MDEPPIRDPMRTTMAVFIESNSRSRLIGFAIAAVAVIGCVWYAVNTHRHEEDTEIALSKHRAPTPLSDLHPLEKMGLPIGHIESQVNKTLTATNEHNSLVDASGNNNLPNAARESAPNAPGIKGAGTTGSLNPASFLSTLTVAPTARAVAATEARSEVGRSDPYMPVTGFKPFPSFKTPMMEAAEQEALAKERASAGKKNSDLVPPPPAVTSAPGPGVPDVPESAEAGPSVPNSRPTVSDSLKLVAVIGDHAILAFTNRQLVAENGWPHTLTLTNGEQFGPVSVQEITPDTVVLSEDGKRTVKGMEPIK